MSRPAHERIRPYDTSEPSQLGQLLSTLFSQRGYGRAQADQQLQEIWQEVAGEQLGAGTRVLSLRGRVLKVGVRSSALLSELVSFRKGELLAAIQEKHPRLQIRDLKFLLRSD